MSNLNQNVIRHKIGLLNLATELGNVSHACKLMGLSRDTFYRYQNALADGGVEALLMPTGVATRFFRLVEEATEAAVLAYTTEQPAMARRAPAMNCASAGYSSPCPACAPSDCATTWFRSGSGWRLWSDRLTRTASYSPKPRWLRWKGSRTTILHTARSRPRILATWVPRTPSMSAPSRTLGASTSRPSSIPTARWPWPKLYTTKTPITATDLLNDRVLPLFAEHGMGVLRILTDRGTEYCGKAETHDYQLYLALNDIEHTKTKVRHPQTNGICERFHKTILQEFYQVAFRRKLYLTLDELQADLDVWLAHYNGERTHQGKMCCGCTPLQTLIAGKEAWQEKIDNLN